MSGGICGRVGLLIAVLGCSGCYAAENAPAEAGADVGAEACQHASDCVPGTLCIGGACVPPTACSSSRMCPGLVCNITMGVCVECVGPTDCRGEASCRGGVCETIVPCATDRDCSASGLVCDTSTGSCAECTAAGDCAPDHFCGPDHTCASDVCAMGETRCSLGSIAGCLPDGSGFAAPEACPSGECAGDACAPGDAGFDAGTADAGAADAGVDAATSDAGRTCRTGALGGIGLPAGTTWSFNAEYPPQLGAYAVDGDLTTAWNGAGQIAWFRLDFASPIRVQGISLAAGSGPEPADETYTITAGGDPTPLATATRHTVPVNPGDDAPVLAPIAIPPADYSSLTISINAGVTWAALFEISLLTADCP